MPILVTAKSRRYYIWRFPKSCSRTVASALSNLPVFTSRQLSAKSTDTVCVPARNPRDAHAQPQRHVSVCSYLFRPQPWQFPALAPGHSSEAQERDNAAPGSGSRSPRRELVRCHLGEPLPRSRGRDHLPAAVPASASGATQTATRDLRPFKAPEKSLIGFGGRRLFAHDELVKLSKRDIASLWPPKAAGASIEYRRREFYFVEGSNQESLFMAGFAIGWHECARMLQSDKPAKKVAA